MAHSSWLLILAAVVSVDTRADTEHSGGLGEFTGSSSHSGASGRFVRN